MRALLSRLLTIIATALAIGTGLVTLTGLLAGDGILNAISDVLLQIAVVTVALTILFGVANLLLVHLTRLRRRERGWPYSIVLVAAAAVVLALWLTGNLNPNTSAEAAQNRVVLESTQIAVESALAALLVFTLVFGAYRLMRGRVTWSAILFTLTLLIVLVGALTAQQAGGVAELVNGARAWLLAVPVSAGARGLLLGIALATVIAAVRILIGQERAYRD